MMGILKIIRDNNNLYGYCIPGTKNSQIYVNIEKIWKESVTRAPKHPETRFIKVFSGTYTHELLHALISQAKKNYDYGEEKIIYTLLGEHWTKQSESYYKTEDELI